MNFKIVFNIIICVIACLVLFVLLGVAVALHDAKKRSDEKSLKKQEVIGRVRAITYIVFFCVLMLMILINLIF